MMNLPFVYLLGLVGGRLEASVDPGGIALDDVGPWNLATTVE